MATQTFINLPVKDVQQTRSFFSALGFSFNEQFSDEKAICMIISDNSFVMLLSEPFFKGFIRTEISDAAKVTEVLMGLSADSRDKVNEMVDKAISMGAMEARDPQDHGFMFSRSFHDLDSHIWEIIWMDMAAFAQQ